MTGCTVGIDLGTSSVRAAAIAQDGTVLGVTKRQYPIDRPRPGYAEQHPQVWWDCTTAALSELLGTPGLPPVAAVGVTGQMHGLVPLDRTGRPVRPAIIWPDTRTSDEVTHLEQALGADTVRKISGISPATGLLGPSLAWLRTHEPHNYDTVATVLLPKDYIQYRLTGVLATDPTDACGTLCYDLDTETWSPAVLSALQLRPELFPDIGVCGEIVGPISPSAVQPTGLPAEVPVVSAGSDQATTAIALGLDHVGDTAIAVSTGGTVLRGADRRPHHDTPGLHSLRGSTTQFLLMGAILSAGQSLEWIGTTLLGRRPIGDEISQLVAEAAQTPPGANGLLFLPYLNGERTPLLDPHATGMFLGLTSYHQRGHLVRAVLEGVALALHESLNIVCQNNPRPETITVSGGGMKNPHWRQILTDIIGIPTRASHHDEHSVVGAALTAAHGAGLVAPTTPPDSGAAIIPRDPYRGLYHDRVPLFRAAYANTRSLMHSLRENPSPG